VEAGVVVVTEAGGVLASLQVAVDEEVVRQDVTRRAKTVRAA